MYKIGTSSFMFTSPMLSFCTSTEVLKWQEQSVYSKRKMAIGAIGFPSLLMLLLFLSVEKNIDREQTEIKARKESK